MLRSSTETLFENTDLTKVKDIEDIDNVLRPFIILPGISEKDRLLACYETLVYFADKIALPVKIGEKVESLNWPIIYEYIKTKLNIDLCDQWYQLSKDIRFKPISLKHSKVKSNKSKRWYTSISFDNEENAKLYLAYIKSLLLPKYQEQLAKISVQGNEKNGSTYTFTLPVEIYRDFEIRLYIWENEKQVKSPDRQSETDSELELESSGEEHGLREITHELPKNSRTSGKILTREERAKKIAYRLRTRGFWIKGLSEGPYDFTQSQVDNTTPKELNGQVAKRSRLRPKEHKRFSVLSDKIVDRQKEKTSRYKGMTQEELEIAKKQHSSPQSVTLVTPIAHPPVFRFKHINKTVIKSAGFIYAYKKENAEGKEEIKGLIHSRIYRDIATISRPLEFDDASEANKFHKAWDKGNRLLFETNEEFEQKVTDSHHNEELVRLYFDKDTDAAAIYCDNFESRCLAVLKARIQRKKLEEGNLIDPGYEVPILYYLPRHEKNLTPYTEAERQVDIQFANEIITKKNKKEVNDKLINENFEFLILVDDKHQEKIQNMVMPKGAPYEGKSLLQALLFLGQLTLLNDLFLRAKKKNPNLTLGGYIWHEKSINLEETGIPQVKQLHPIDDDTIIHLAARLGYVEITTYLMSQSSKIHNQLNSAKQTPLQLAVINGHIQLVEELLKIETCQRDETLFYLAVQHGHKEIAKNILKYIDPLFICRHLFQKIGKREDKPVYLLWDIVNDTNAISHIHGIDLLALIAQAMKWGYFDIAGELLNKCIDRDDIKNQTDEIYQLLKLAIRNGQINLVEKLDKLIPSNDLTQSCLDYAVTYGHVEVVRYFLDKYLTEQQQRVDEDLKAVYEFAKKQNHKELLEKLNPIFDNNNQSALLIEDSEEFSDDELFLTSSKEELEQAESTPLIVTPTISTNNTSKELLSYIDEHSLKWKFHYAKEHQVGMQGYYYGLISVGAGILGFMLAPLWPLLVLNLAMNAICFGIYLGYALFSDDVAQKARNKSVQEYYKYKCETMANKISNNHFIKEWVLTGFFPVMDNVNISDVTITKGLKQFLHALRMNPVVTKFTLDTHILENKNPYIVRLVKKIQEEVKNNTKNEKTSEETHWHFVREKLKKTVNKEIKRIKKDKRPSTFLGSVTQKKLQQLSLFKQSIKLKTFGCHNIDNLVASVNEWTSNEKTIAIMNSKRGVGLFEVTSSRFTKKLTNITDSLSSPARFKRSV